MKKNLITLLIGSSLLIALQNCKKEENPEVKPEPTPLNAKYNPTVKNIMDNYCITCHSGASPSASLSLSTYSEVKDAALNRGLLTRMKSTSNPMPASGNLSSDKLAQVENWITNGHPEN